MGTQYVRTRNERNVTDTFGRGQRQGHLLCVAEWRRIVQAKSVFMFLWLCYGGAVVLAGWPSAVANRDRKSSRWRHHDDSIGAGGEARGRGSVEGRPHAMQL